MSRGPYYPVGPYWGRVTQQALGVSSNGNPQFVLRFLVLGKIDPADPEGELIACEKYERTLYRTITDKTMDYFLKDLELIGYDRDSFKYLDPNTPDHFNMVDRELGFYVSHKPTQDNNGMKEEWGFARGSSQLEVKPIEPKKLRDLDNLFGKQLKSLRRPAPKPTGNQPPDGNPAMPTDEELAEANAGPPDLPF